MISSCNGCRVLRKGCNENCLLRQSLTLINSPSSQANATLFVTKFFGRAPLFAFLSSVSPSLRPVMFQSLLYEACGRTVNPVTGAVGLMYTGNWILCQKAVETVLRGEKPAPITDFLHGHSCRKKRRFNDDVEGCGPDGIDLDLRLMTGAAPKAGVIGLKCGKTVSYGSEEYGTETTSFTSGSVDEEEEVNVLGKGLRLF